MSEKDSSDRAFRPVGAVRRWRARAVAGAVVVAAIAGRGSVKDARGRGPGFRGYPPHVLQRAYGVLPLLQEGIDGRGETVVLPEIPPITPPGDSRHAPPGVIPPQGSGIRRDLQAFDKRYHLPPVELTLSRALGYTGELSRAGDEDVLDAETVHAIAGTAPGRAGTWSRAGAVPMRRCSYRCSAERSAPTTGAGCSAART